MVGAVIVTHGHLAEALLEAARLIVGELPQVEAVSLEPWDGPDMCSEKLVRAVERNDQGDGVLVFADLLGGTPCNVGLACAVERRIEVVTGVNLSMLVKLRSLQLAGLTLNQIAHEVAGYGTRSVKVASEGLPQRAAARNDSK